MTLILIVLSGCSISNLTTPGANEDASQLKLTSYTPNQWIWGDFKIRISADRKSAEILPQRTASYYLNITSFVEGPPCPKCLWIGKIISLPGGTIQLKINLQHPFYGHPEYTGFDVRGICVFKATDYLVNKFVVIQTVYGSTLASGNVPIYYSDPLKGGAALLNADGYTYTLNPMINMKGSKEGVLFNLPIFDYSKAKHAYGDVDTVVNPYKLFSDISPRRMFKHYDLFTRTYHIKPPEGSGPFEFGYVVSACWAPPIKTPVTNPETDFPITANCEDAYEISIVQLTPCTQEKYNNYEPIFKAIIKHRIDQKPYARMMIISSTFLKSNHPWLGDDDMNCFFCSYFGPGHPSYHPDDVKEIDDETTELIFRANEDLACAAYSVVPGWHLGILTFLGQEQLPAPGAQFMHPPSVHPVMMYVQE
jgi:hypothetical protein